MSKDIKKEQTMHNKKWIWQGKNYPNFAFSVDDFKSLLDEIQANNEAINKIIANNKISTNLLEIKIKSLTSEIINSAAIEGEFLKQESVKNSLKKKLDESFDEFKDKHSTTQSDNYALLLLDANLNKAPLTKERLHGWHNCLFESGYSGLHKINIAKFRNDEMQVVSGRIGCEKVYYEAPLPQDIDESMQTFFNYCNDKSVDSFVQSAVAHLWFVVIHPYDDGNGRIARAIADFLLPNENIKLYSISAQINSNRKKYYENLEKTTANNPTCDISQWLEWYLNITNLAIKSAMDELNRLVFKTDFWDTFRNANLSQGQQKALNKLLDIGVGNFNGKFDVKKYASFAKVNSATAQKEFDELVKIGALVENEPNSFTLWHNDNKSINNIFNGCVQKPKGHRQ